MKRLLIRADASATIGTGHIMRCLALAEAWQDKGEGEVHFACAELPAVLAERLEKENCLLHPLSVHRGASSDAEATACLAQKIGADWIIIDGYCFDTAFQRFVRNTGIRTLLLDDNGENMPWDCDAILNQNPHAYEVDYHARTGFCHLLLGSSFALLRREFREALARHTAAQDQHEELRLLVMLGGADEKNVSGSVLSILEKYKKGCIHSVRVLCGAANSHVAALKQTARQLPFACEIIHNATDMSVHYQWANAAITAAGSTCWELSAFVIPFMPIAVAPNQERIARLLGGILWNEEGARSEIPAWIENLRDSNDNVSACMLQIDSHGAERVCDFLDTPHPGLRANDVTYLSSFNHQDTNFYLRMDREEDSRQLFEWANDPAVRRQSFHSKPITWCAHQQWHANRKNRVIYICERNASIPIGSIRFENTRPDKAIVSIQLDGSWRGKGLASPLISTASRLYSRSHRTQKIVAKIKSDNPASRRAFEKADYRFSTKETDHLIFHYHSHPMG